ncbi:MAG: hypothetical protein Q9182_004742 [Xanthomendoza sp. 2 TL-2023]
MPLEPTDVLRMIVATVWILARQGWTSRVDLAKVDPTILPPEATVFIAITRAPMRGDQLQAGHVILALHQAIFQMAGPPQSFCGWRATLKLRDRPIAIMSITNQRPPRRPQINPSPDDSIMEFVKSNATRAPPEKRFGADAGVISDPDIPHCQIAWAYVPQGHTMDEEDVWTAWVDTMANIAYHSLLTPFDHVVGYGAPGLGRAALRLTASPAAQLQLDWVSVLSFVGVIGSQVIVKERRFAEMRFGVRYGPRELVRGELYKDWTGGIQTISQS